MKMGGLMESGSQAVQPVTSTLSTATKPYTDFFWDTMSIPSKLVTPKIEQLRPALQTVLGQGVGDQVTDSLKAGGGIMAAPWLMPESELGEVAGEAETAHVAKHAAGKTGVKMAGGAMGEEGFGEAAHQAHLAQHVTRLAAGEEEQEPKEWGHLVNPNSPDFWGEWWRRQRDSTLQMLGGSK